MIIETELEAKALAYVLNLASAVCDNRGCNDLEPEEVERFKEMVVEREDFDGTKIKTKPLYDFDITEFIRVELEKNGYKDG